MAAVSQQPEWKLGKADSEAVARIIQQVRCPRAIAELVVMRGILGDGAVNAFFNPSLDHLHDPMLMLGMVEAVARVQRAVRDGESILIYGDYDVDGTVATVLLKTAIERIAPKNRPAKVTYHVPHRIREGYGMRAGVLGQAASDGVKLVISVDTGIRAFAAAGEAKALGLDLIVTDHHLPDEAEGVPEALAVVNPAQEGCNYPFKWLCGAGVAFKLAQAILRAACENEEERERLRKVLLPSFLKLVAIATIADSVPLEGENRTIAALGLRELKKPVQPGLRALMEVAKIAADRSPTATEVGFRIAPRINAAGRMDIASDVVEMFLTRDVGRAVELAQKLNRLNDERRATEARALAAIEQRLLELRNGAAEFPAECIVLDDPEWHRGVLGILASRVVDRTGRPALVVSHEDGEAHGSGRSIEGFHLLNALTTVHAETDGGLFTRFGGHAHAVGFSLSSEHVRVLREGMRSFSASLLSSSMLAPPLECDVEVTFCELTPDFADWLARCGPFGAGNREPVFVSCGLRVAREPRVIKERHICLELDGDGRRFSALGWSRGEEWLARCSQLALGPDAVVDVAYRLRSKTHPQSPGLELELVDLRLAQPGKDIVVDGSVTETKTSASF
jgi:single-stranded-DNA-specific exonuclease